MYNQSNDLTTGEQFLRQSASWKLVLCKSSHGFEPEKVQNGRKRKNLTKKTVPELGILRYSQDTPPQDS